LLTAFALKAVGAIVVWIFGRWLFGFAVSLITRALQRQHVDPTLLRYIGNIVIVSLNVILVVAILGYFGVETTSFAALVAAMGVAIGAAWGGPLANFAAGAFLIVLRPSRPTLRSRTRSARRATPRRRRSTASVRGDAGSTVPCVNTLGRAQRSWSPRPSATPSPCRRSRYRVHS